MSLQPHTFEDELNLRCSWGRRSSEYRVRWSPFRETWEIEQQVGQPVTLPPKVKQTDPDLWQATKDGYALVARVSPAKTFKCKQCLTRLAAPEGRFAEVDCLTCRRSRRYNNIQYFVAYWPLSESLVRHLEQSHPRRLKEWIREMDARNQALADAEARDAGNALEAGLMDHYYHLAGVPRTSSLTNSLV